MGTSQPDPLIPYIFPIALSDGMRHGRGVIRFVVTAAIGADVTITHKLGRVPQLIVPLDNGTSYLPQWRRSATTPWSVGAVSVQFSTACNAPGLFLWIV